MKSNNISLRLSLTEGWNYRFLSQKNYFQQNLFSSLLLKKIEDLFYFYLKQKNKGIFLFFHSVSIHKFTFYISYNFSFFFLGKKHAERNSSVYIVKNYRSKWKHRLIHIFSRRLAKKCFRTFVKNSRIRVVATYKLDAVALVLHLRKIKSLKRRLKRMHLKNKNKRRNVFLRMRPFIRKQRSTNKIKKKKVIVKSQSMPLRFHRRLRKKTRKFILRKSRRYFIKNFSFMLKNVPIRVFSGVSLRNVKIKKSTISPKFQKLRKLLKRKLLTYRRDLERIFHKRIPFRNDRTNLQALFFSVDFNRIVRGVNLKYKAKLRDRLLKKNMFFLLFNNYFFKLRTLLLFFKPLVKELQRFQRLFISKRLKVKLFFSTIALHDYTAEFLAHVVKFRMENKQYVNQVIFPLARDLYFKSKGLFKGIKIMVRGRFSRALRAQKRVVAFGLVGVKNLKNNMTYWQTEVKLRNSIVGIKVSVHLTSKARLQNWTKKFLMR